MMSEPTERDVEASSRLVLTLEAWGIKDPRAVGLIAKRIAEARREGAAKVTARVEVVAEKWKWYEAGDVYDDIHAALRGDT